MSKSLKSIFVLSLFVLAAILLFVSDKQIQAAAKCHSEKSVSSDVNVSDCNAAQKKECKEAMRKCKKAKACPADCMKKCCAVKKGCCKTKDGRCVIYPNAVKNCPMKDKKDCKKMCEKNCCMKKTENCKPADANEPKDSNAPNKCMSKICKAAAARKLVKCKKPADTNSVVTK